MKRSEAVDLIYELIVDFEESPYNWKSDLAKDILAKLENLDIVDNAWEPEND